MSRKCVCDTTGKTSRARALAHYYNTPVLVIDDFVTEALYYSGTPAAVAARLLCTEAAARAADVSPATDSNTDKSAPRMLRCSLGGEWDKRSLIIIAITLFTANQLSVYFQNVRCGKFAIRGYSPPNTVYVAVIS